VIHEVRLKGVLDLAQLELRHFLEQHSDPFLQYRPLSLHTAHGDGILRPVAYAYLIGHY
jgi:hypothetical protein